MATYLLQTYSSQSKSCSCCCSSCEDLGYVTSCTPSTGSAASDGYDFESPGDVVTCEAVSVTCPQNKDYQLSCYKKVTTPFMPPPTPASTAAPSSDPTCTDCGDPTQPLQNNIAPDVFAASYNNIQACINAGINFRFYGIGFIQGNVEMLCGGICFRCS